MKGNLQPRATAYLGPKDPSYILTVLTRPAHAALPKGTEEEFSTFFFFQAPNSAVFTCSPSLNVLLAARCGSDGETSFLLFSIHPPVFLFF